MATYRPAAAAVRPKKVGAAPQQAIADTVAAHANASARPVKPEGGREAAAGVQLDAAAAGAAGSGSRGACSYLDGSPWQHQGADAASGGSHNTDCSIDGSSSAGDSTEDVDEDGDGDCLGERRIVSVDGGCSSIFAGSTPYDVRSWGLLTLTTVLAAVLNTSGCAIA